MATKNETVFASTVDFLDAMRNAGWPPQAIKQAEQAIASRRQLKTWNLPWAEEIVADSRIIEEKAAFVVLHAANSERQRVDLSRASLFPRYTPSIIRA